MIKLNKQDPRPLYLQIKDNLRTALNSGQYKPDEALPDERSLAIELGLSRMTVRRALVELTAEGLLQRIPGRGTFIRPEGAPKPAGHIADHAASKPMAPRAKIAMVTNFDQSKSKDSLFYIRIIEGMHHAADDDASLTLYSIAQPNLVERLKADGVAGIVMLGISDVAASSVLIESGIPCVMCDSTFPQTPSPFDFVTYNNELGEKAAVSSLLDLGHRDIALLIHCNSNDPQTAVIGSVGLERRRGYEAAFRERNLQVNEKLILPVITNTAAGFVVFREKLAAMQPMPTAVVCTADEVALGVIEAAKEAGLRVPADVSVIGFGDIGLFCVPQMSTVRMQMEASGSTAVRLLLERMRYPKDPIRTVSLPTEFIQRGSCAMPRPADRKPI